MHRGSKGEILHYIDTPDLFIPPGAESESIRDALGGKCSKPQAEVGSPFSLYSDGANRAELSLFDSAPVHTEEGFTIATLSSPDSLKELEELQMKIWGFKDTLDIIPAEFLSRTARRNGLIAAAYDPEGVPVGFTICYPARDEATGKASLHLDLVGVMDGYRHARLGEKLMAYIATKAESAGISLITWTYDPLEGANANLYLKKCGAVATKFKPNVYGEISADLYTPGSRTDRFWVEWRLPVGRVAAFPPNAVVALDSIDGKPHVREEALCDRPPHIICKIPRQAADEQTHVEWQNAFFLVATSLMNDARFPGYTVHGFRVGQGDFGEYLLVKKPTD